MKREALGRGLGALIEIEPKAAVGSLHFNEIPIEQIFANPNQPRTQFNDEALEELAASIRVNGIISPITLRRLDDDKYQIIAGERRFRASKLAGLVKVPAYIRVADDYAMMEMALIENIQREDLNAIEIALSYNNLLVTNSLTQEALAERVGKKRATVTNYLRLLKLPAEIQMGLKNRKIEMGHARALVGVGHAERQLAIYEQILREGASVRRAEQIVRSESNTGESKEEEAKFLPEEYDQLRDAICNLLHSDVKLTYNDKGRGKITISFRSDDELTRLMGLFDKIR